VIWKAVRLRGYPQEKAQAAIQSIFDLGLAVVTSELLLAQAFQLALRHRSTVYNALYIALARRRQCLFITADERLIDAIQPEIPKVCWLGRLK
jgi:predicted nucleic acid-binding protein